MPHEILYTSAPHGLKPGSQGFCTVVSTAGIPTLLAEKLESLSGYRQVYTGEQAALNPINYSHVALTLGGRQYHVLSSVRDAGQDYTQRSNKLAHHVALQADELPQAGPAVLLAKPEFCETAWDGVPRLLPAGRRLPSGDRPPGVCHAWAEVTGDAGWAGVLAESVLQRPARPTVLVFPPGMDLLPLVVEAVALLPAERRWDVTFSTYFTKSATGSECLWRFVLEGTPEAQSARRAGPVWDLTRPMIRAQGGPLVEAARAGILTRTASIPPLPPPLLEVDEPVEPPPQRPRPQAASGAVNLSPEVPTPRPLPTAPGNGRPAAPRPAVIVVRSRTSPVAPIVVGVVALVLIIPLTVGITWQLTRSSVAPTPSSGQSDSAAPEQVVQTPESSPVQGAAPLQTPKDPATPAPAADERIASAKDGQSVGTASKEDPAKANALNRPPQDTPKAAEKEETSKPKEKVVAPTVSRENPKAPPVPQAERPREKKFVVLGANAAVCFHKPGCPGSTNSLQLQGGDELYVPPGASVRIDVGGGTFVTASGADVFGSTLQMEKAADESSSARIHADSVKLRIDWTSKCRLELSFGSQQVTEFQTVTDSAAMILEITSGKLARAWFSRPKIQSPLNFNFAGLNVTEVSTLPSLGAPRGALPNIPDLPPPQVLGATAASQHLTKVGLDSSQPLAVALIHDLQGDPRPILELMKNGDPALIQVVEGAPVWYTYLNSIPDWSKFEKSLDDSSDEVKWRDQWMRIRGSNLEKRIQELQPQSIIDIQSHQKTVEDLNLLLDWLGDKSPLKRALAGWKLRRVAADWQAGGKNKDKGKFKPVAMPNAESIKPESTLSPEALKKWNAWITAYLK